LTGGIRRPAVLILAALLLTSIGVSGCGDDPPSEDAAAENTPNATEAPPGAEFVEFDAANFGEDSAVIDNQWTPMLPGSRWVYEGVSIDEGARSSHRIEFTVTDLTKEIQGVQTRAAWIIDIADGEIVEKELAFYAQDSNGNVWYFGEHPEEYKGGEFLAAPTWFAGVEDARPGLKMWADPQPGIPSYYQGWAPEVDWSDFGTIDELGGRTCVPTGCYEDVLVVAESSLDEVGIYQLKYYARGVGEVRVGWRGDPQNAEELELTEYVQLDADGLAPIRDEALALEAHAYDTSKEYSFTSPSVWEGQDEAQAR
jgi:hypothetical protein